MDLTIATWNVNGIRARKDQVLDFLQAERPAVLLLQEVKASPEQVPLDLREHPEYWTFWHGAGGYSGVAALASKQIFDAPPRATHPEFDFESRALALETPQGRFVSLYVPNGGKDFEAKLRFLAELGTWSASSPSPTLLAGDLNVARTDRDVHPRERKPGQIGTRPEERELLEGLLARGFDDLGRRFEPDNDGLFTWWAPWRNLRARNIGWRIDYVLGDRAFAERARGAGVRAAIGTSDHAPVVASFEA
jgi:exodeoxyribonuclease-3